MSSKRIYIITDKHGHSRLVEATNPAQALRHVANDMYAVRPAGTYDVARLVKDGAPVEQASGAEQ